MMTYQINDDLFSILVDLSSKVPLEAVQLAGVTADHRVGFVLKIRILIPVKWNRTPRLEENHQ